MQKFCILERLGCQNSSWPFFRRISQLTRQPPRGYSIWWSSGWSLPVKPFVRYPPGLKQILSANRSRTILDVCERLDPVLCPYCPYLIATLRLRGRPVMDGCESALWDFFNGTNLPPCYIYVPQKSSTMHFDNISTRHPAQPQSG